MHPPDPQTQRAALAGDPEAKNSNQHPKRYQLPLEVQAGIALATPTFLLVLLLTLLNAVIGDDLDFATGKPR
jgi:hypothetical protein